MGSYGCCFNCAKILVMQDGKDGVIKLLPSDEILMCKECEKNFQKTIDNVFANKRNN